MHRYFFNAGTPSVSASRYFVTCLLTTLFIFILIKPVAVFSAEISSLKVGASNNFPPVNMLDDKGELIGFGREIATAVLRAEGIEPEYQHSSTWSEVEGWLRNGKIDLIHDTGFNVSREKYLDYSLPILEMPEVIFVRNDQYDIHSFDDLAGRMVACVDKHISHIYLKQYPDIECHIVHSPAEAVIALINNDVDAFVFPRQVGLHLMQKFDFSGDVKIVGEPLRILKWGMTVRKGRTELVSTLNSGIRKIHASGEYAAIYDKWFGHKLLQGYSVEQVIWIVVISLLVTLLLVVSLGLYAYSRRVKQHNRLLYQTVKHLEQTQQELDESEFRYAEVGDFIPGAIFQVTVDASGNIADVHVTAGVEQLAGISAEEIISNPHRIIDRIIGLSRSNIVNVFKQATRENKKWSIELSLNKSETESLSVWCSAQPHSLENGNIVWSGVVLDISGRVQAEEEVKRLQIFLDSVVDNLPAAIFVKDAKDLRYVRLNQAAEKLFGVSHEVIFGKNDYDFWPKEEADFFTNYDREVLAGGAMVDIPEEPLHTRNNGLRTLHTKKIPIHDENGKPIYLLGMSEDITERKQVEEQLAQHREHLEELVEERTRELRILRDEALQASKAKSAFLANMSHELRTPLSSIIGFSEILKTGTAGQVNEEQVRQLGMVNTSARRLLALISDILDLSRVEAGKTDVNITEFRLDELLTEIKELLQPQFDGKDVVLKLENMSTRDKIRTDRGKLHQILLNLLGNANKFTQQGHVLLRCRDNDAMIVFEVEDTGIGIAREQQSQIFEVFKQADEQANRAYEGTGLGLAICREYARLLRGYIELHSEPGQGSCFSLHLRLQV